MSSGIFCVQSDKGLSTSNGHYIKYGQKEYLISCSHSFYDKGIKEINFFTDPKLENKNIVGSCHLKNLPLPLFHPNDTDTETHEIAVFQLSNEHSDILKSKNISPSEIAENTDNLSPQDILVFEGFDTNLFNDENFEGTLALNRLRLSYILFSKRITGPHPKSSRAPVNCYVAAKNKPNDLGEGFSGSKVVSSSSNKIIGIYHTSAAPLKNGFDQLTPEGCAIFCSTEKVVQTIKMA